MASSPFLLSEGAGRGYNGGNERQEEPMEHIFIINPKAGKGRGPAYVPEIREYFRERGEEPIIRFTESPGHGEQLAREYRHLGKDARIYAVGGDGTLNEVLNGLGTWEGALGVLPAGSGNDFFRMLEEAPGEGLLSRTIEGEAAPMDLGQAGERYFLNVASAGLDAAIVENARRFKTLPLLGGMAAYILGIFYTVFRYASIPSTLSFRNLEGEEVKLEGKVLLAAAANGRCYGGGMKIAPEARTDSGFLEVYRIAEASPLRILFLFPRLIQGNHESLPEIFHDRSGAFTLESPLDFPVNADGEVFRASRITFRLLPSGVRIIRPRAPQV